MITKIIPEKNLNVFLMMEIVLKHVWKNKKKKISISGIETDEDIDNLFNNGIRIKYAESENYFIDGILADLNKKRLNFSIRYGN